MSDGIRLVSEKAKLLSEKVRSMKFEELDSLLELYKHLNPEDPDISKTSLAREIWGEIYNDPDLHYLVMEEDGMLVSSCTLAVIRNLTRGGRPYGLIENVVTHPCFRNRGYASSVLQKAVDICRGKGCYKVMLLTSRKEESTLRFYERAGFERGTKTGFVKKLE